MNWTKEPPKEPGAYWYRDEHGLWMCYVKEIEGYDYDKMQERTFLEVNGIHTENRIAAFMSANIEHLIGDWWPEKIKNPKRWRLEVV